MKNKKILSLVIAVVLISVVGIGATLAYFTDKDSATNVITMGHVDVDLTEPGFDTEDGEEDNTITDITPGEEIVKDPTITVKEGSEDAYVRATIEINGLTDVQKAELLAGIEINDGWVLSDDNYYYYQNKMTEGETATLFDTVMIPEKWGNEVANVTFEIVVNAEAIQADNFNPTTDADGNIVAWNYTDGTAITAENYVAPGVSSGDAQ